MKVRSSNFELLRIIAMLMIVLHHLMVHGVFKGFDTTEVSGNQALALIFAAGGKVGVGLFIMITGYFLANKLKTNIPALVSLWLQVFFYSVVIFLLLSNLKMIDAADPVIAISNVFPLIFNKYWFFTDYFLIMIIAPVINAGFSNFEKKEVDKIMGVLLFVWFVVPTISPLLFNRVLSVSSNDLLILIMFYLFGYYIRRYNPAVLNKQRNNIILIGAGIVMTSGLELYFECLGHLLKDTSVYTLSFQYYKLNSFSVFLIVVGLFGLFKNFRIGEVKWINTVASATFGVYLIHDNSYIRSLLWRDWVESTDYLAFGIFGFIVASAITVVVFVLSTVIELIRKNTIERFTNYLLKKSFEKN
ncbi:acyltransferase [Weissella cibaria]|uniref:acyltransferase n=1 Tax=Weissella cibaria TaxID=137591 RepID=UPI0035BC2D60